MTFAGFRLVSDQGVVEGAARPPRVDVPPVVDAEVDPLAGVNVEDYWHLEPGVRTYSPVPVVR